ncbi:hypothetical protein [Salmonirosea aquatica]|uniref:Lipocalin-like domain-containing protein n=1 Tax=Salmonirosea aquatica TaxID=2654236 RepID=A0A7C9BDW0_9BACT|nr:hypothetical protein [Cytophagaceae bacterium SJW1-29]
MKKLLVLFLIVSVAACTNKDDEPKPDYATNFVGEYWTNTADGANSTAQTWVVTSTTENTLNIVYTIDYTFKNQGKVFTSKDVYQLKDIQVLNPVSFKIDQDAELNEDGTLKTRHVSGEATKSKDGSGGESIGITLTFKDPGATTTTSTDFLEFKKR